MTSFVGGPALADRQDMLKGPYAARFQEFTEAGRQAGLAPSQTDTQKVAVILVDYQHDFVDPGGTLSVPGAQEDVVRFLDWFYRHASRITTIYASQDCHVPEQIFFSSWWKDPRTGEHPQPFTVITADDVAQERWVPVLHAEWSRRYVHLLADKARKDLMLWPYHTMEGTLGQMLVAPISEAIAWHSAARKARPVHLVKGLTTRTEYYGIFGAEVPDPDDPGSNLDAKLLNEVMQHDQIYIAGEAKSHCVLETERQLLEYLGQQPERLQQLHFLTDCTSSVQHPAIDFDQLAEQELAQMQALGVHLTKSGKQLQGPE